MLKMAYHSNNCAYIGKYTRRILFLIAVSTLLYRIFVTIHPNQPISFKYAVVFDAGSTATRIHIYRFTDKQKGNWKLSLVDEYFEEIKPGISSLQGALESEKQTETLIENGFRHFPEARLHTGIQYAYRATAGIRSISDHERRNSLLNGVKEAISRYAEHHQVSVSILDGEDEGIFAWITLAYLLNSKDNYWPLMASIDMGGMSLQITSLAKSNISKRILLSSIGGYSDELNVASVSLSGLGLASFRKQMLTDGKSPCMKDSWPSTKLDFQGTIYNVHGNNGDNNQEICKNNIYKVINDIIANNVIPDITSNKIYLFSNFYDAALKSKLVRDSKGGTILAKDFDNSARHWCSLDKISGTTKDEQFMCLDLSYMYYILNSVLKLDNDQRIEIVKRIDGIEISWTLGLVLTII